MHSPIWISRFTDATRQAATYRSGRVLLAGDAAHIHYPAGGQGIGLGIQDAVNLGWKLARVVKGDSPESLLDTYTAERHPPAARALKHSMAQTVLQRSDPRAAALTETIDELMVLDQPRVKLAALIHGLDIAYDFGEGHPLLGRRMPDLDVVTADGSVRVYALLRDARPVLLDFGQSAVVDGHGPGAGRRCPIRRCVGAAGHRRGAGAVGGADPPRRTRGVGRTGERLGADRRARAVVLALSAIQQSEPSRGGDGPSARRLAELAQHRRDMVLDRPRRHDEQRSDLGRRQAAIQQHQHLELARGQLARAGCARPSAGRRGSGRPRSRRVRRIACTDRVGAELVEHAHGTVGGCRVRREPAGVRAPTPGCPAHPTRPPQRAASPVHREAERLGERATTSGAGSLPPSMRHHASSPVAHGSECASASAHAASVSGPIDVDVAPRSQASSAAAHAAGAMRWISRVPAARSAASERKADGVVTAPREDSRGGRGSGDRRDRRDVGMVEQREGIREGVVEAPDVAEGDAAPRPHVACPRVEVAVLAVRDAGIEVHESGGVPVLGDRLGGEIGVGARGVLGQVGGEREIEAAGEQRLALRRCCPSSW